MQSTVFKTLGPRNRLLSRRSPTQTNTMAMLITKPKMYRAPDIKQPLKFYPTEQHEAEPDDD